MQFICNKDTLWTDKPHKIKSKELILDSDLFFVKFVGRIEDPQINSGMKWSAPIQVTLGPIVTGNGWVAMVTMSLNSLKSKNLSQWVVTRVLQPCEEE